MMGLTAGISGDGTTDRRVVAEMIAALRSGKTMVLKMHSDDYIRQYASDDDYAYWLSAKVKLSETKNVA